MLDGRNLVVDLFSEVYQLLKPWVTHTFWNFAEHEIVPNSVYIICRKQFHSNIERIKEMLDRNDVAVFFDNAAEGSLTLVKQLQLLGIDELAKQKKLLLIGGGDMEEQYANLQYDHFLSCIVDYPENISVLSSIDSIFSKTEKPYTFLFLNGRARPHRKYLFEKFRQSGTLETSLWTMLDSSPSISRHLRLLDGTTNLLATESPIRQLPAEYEYKDYRKNTVDRNESGTDSLVKYKLFNNKWGEIYLEPGPYIDTYFSLVTETVFEYPYSFRTEKIAKPLMIGHPFIVAANRGFYRDLRNLGFRTFEHVIDESFDQVDNHQDRMDRVVQIVEDLCRDSLSSFLAACHDTCKYNQQHLLELSPQLKSSFPQRFFEMVK